MRHTLPPASNFAALLLGMSATATVHSAALAQTAPSGPTPVRTGAPEGFAGLVNEQRAVVDIWFAGRRIGEAEVRFRPGRLSFVNAGRVVALLPDLTDREGVLRALSKADLPSHPELVCTPGSDRAKCGSLDPVDAGIVFDETRFRVDIFIGRDLLAPQQAETRRYLATPEAGISVVNGISAILSGSNDRSAIANLENRLTVGDADRRLRADISYASNLGVMADTLALEIDRPDLRYLAGAFWAPGNDLVGRRKIVGVGIETQIDTRLDREALLGAPLIVFLPRRSRVDIMRDGRILASRIYDGGSQSLDTSNLPRGSYEVTLVIEEAAGATRSERRFFTKNPRIAAPGQNIYHAYAGLLADESRRQFLSPTGTPFLQAGAARRIAARFAIDASATATHQGQLVQVGAYYIGRSLTARISAIGSVRGQRGALVQVFSNGNSRVNFDLDMRRFHIPARDAHGLAGAKPALITTESPYPQAGSSELMLHPQSYSQVSGNISYHLPRAQFRLAGYLRKEHAGKAMFSVGPSIRWEVLQRDQLRLYFNGEAQTSHQGNTGYVGLSLQILGRKSTFASSIGARTNAYKSEPKLTSLVADMSGSLQTHGFDGAEVNLGAAFERDINQDLGSLDAMIRGKSVSFNSSVVRGLGGGNSATQYSLGVQTSVAMGGGTIAFDGRNRTESMLVVDIDGAPHDSTFEVLIDNSVAATVRSGGSLSVSLPSYREYEVRIRPVGASLIDYDGTSRNVSLFPGNVARLHWQAAPIASIFGRLIDEAGLPVKFARISTPGGIAVSGGEGHFQIESKPATQLEVTRQDGQACTATLPAFAASTSYTPVGTLSCRTVRQAARLSSLDKAHTENGSSRP